HHAGGLRPDPVRSPDRRAVAVLYRTDAPPGQARGARARTPDPARRHSPDLPERQTGRHRHTVVGRLRARTQPGPLRPGWPDPGAGPPGRAGLSHSPAQPARTGLVESHRTGPGAVPG